MSAALLGGPAHALDCRKASTGLEHRLCADPGLRKADAAMGKAYFDLLGLATDPEVRAALINSQRRWIAAREKDLGGLGEGEDAPNADEQRAILLDATAQRTKYLSERVGGTPKLIADAMKQRARVAAYSGGSFAGYRANCAFIPDRQDRAVYSYNCFGVMNVQNGDRICSVSEDFASHYVVMQRAVADVVGGKPRVIAACVDSQCPGVSVTGQAAGWNFDPTPEQADIVESFGPLNKLDPDIAVLSDDDDWLALPGLRADQGWLNACLTDKSFPKRGRVSDGHGRK
ncbi:lysozyme inhibitor LprI family protein [Lysobacter capsici]|uniref:lysozyme inhibitor LprI family protein n=1 Tax=Lysobacter capsici TaxID=435897 RepID=UPI00257A6536|nr:lysozyme inhibitor LprI family protein [Lysobacter capsici]